MSDRLDQSINVTFYRLITDIPAVALPSSYIAMGAFRCEAFGRSFVSDNYKRWILLRSFQLIDGV